MAFRKKWKSILAINPDIITVQECESPEKFKEEHQIPNYTSFLWYGENPNKGIAIISFNGYKLKLRNDYDPAYKYIIPLAVSGPMTFDLFAIWAMPDKVKRHGYVGQIWRALQHYHITPKTVLVGDFNSNKIWDKERQDGNHSAVITLLAQHGIISIYHELNKEEHGQEKTPTIFLLKQIAKPYHLDYCCCPTTWINSKTTIHIGDPKEWLKLSDHMPIIVDNLLLNSKS